MLTSTPVLLWSGISSMTGCSSRKSSPLYLLGYSVLHQYELKLSDRCVNGRLRLPLGKDKGLIVWKFYLPAKFLMSFCIKTLSLQAS